MGIENVCVTRIISENVCVVNRAKIVPTTLPADFTAILHLRRLNACRVWYTLTRYTRYQLLGMARAAQAPELCMRAEGRGATTSFSRQLLLALMIIIVGAKLAGLLSTRLGQPAVLGELLAGLVLGPTMLNMFEWSFFTNTHLHDTIIELAEIGVVLLMFIAGLEIDLDELRKSGTIALFGGVLGVLVLLLLGFAVALPFGYSITQALFVGVLLTATSVSIGPDPARARQAALTRRAGAARRSGDRRCAGDLDPIAVCGPGGRRRRRRRRGDHRAAHGAVSVRGGAAGQLADSARAAYGRPLAIQPSPS